MNIFNSVVDTFVGRNIVSGKDILLYINIFGGDFVLGEDIRWKITFIGSNY